MFNTIYEGDLFGIGATYYEVVWVYQGGWWWKRKKKKVFFADFKVKNIVVGMPPEIPPNPIPLPASLPLFASGAVIVGLIGWRRRRNAAA